GGGAGGGWGGGGGRGGGGFRAGVETGVVSRGLNVRQVLTKVVLGEADAGIVYRSDAHSAGNRVQTVEIPAEVNVVAEYPIATVADSLHADLARAWVALVRGSAGQAALSAA